MANVTRGWFRTTGAACGLVLAFLTTPAHADEIWVAPTYQQDLGGVGTSSNTFWPVTVAGAVRLAWAVPNDLQTFQSAKIVLIPGTATALSSSVNVFVCTAQNLTSAGSACANPAPVPFAASANQLVEVEIGPLLLSRIGTPGATYLAVLAYTTPNTASDHIVGMRFTYTPKAATGFATLAANTFTGTQTAPAFSGSFNGNGAGLTNLPFPGGAATLGANTFTGAQTAPSFAGSFSGNGSALTNLPFPAGAATLGANTFTATQTIGTGNIALTDSSASSGNLVKNGTLFLHNFGAANVFLGAAAGNLTMTGGDNTGVGSAALTGVTSGQGNVALGSRAGFNATTGSNNIYLGASVEGAAGESNTMYLGRHGIQTRAFIGGVRDVTTGVADAMPVVIDSAGQLGTAPASLATLGANTFTGTQTAPAFAGDGSALTNLPFPAGAATLGANTYSGVQTAPAFLGSGAFLFNLPFPAGAATLGANTFTSTQTINGGNLDLDASTSTAGNILKDGTLFLHNFGGSNLFLGLGAGNTTTTGAWNVAMGTATLAANIDGVGNTAAGFQALQKNTSGGANSGIGWLALTRNTVGNFNTADGANSMAFNSTGTSNTAVGYNTLASNSTGGSNVALGANAGSNATTGAANIYLGADVTGVGGESNTMYLGKVGTQTKAFVAGVRGITTVNPNAIPVMIDSAGQLGTISSSARFKEDVHDMGDTSRRLLQLRPVTFRYTQAYINGAKPIQYGLIAEEVAAVFPELAVRGADGQVETVHYETLNILLLNELQKQEQHVKDQDARIDALEQQLRALLERLTPR